MSNMPKVGDSAPGFELPDSTGKMQTLEGLIEEGAIMLFFFRGLW
jgi:peroxiredoxin